MSCAGVTAETLLARLPPRHLTRQRDPTWEKSQKRSKRVDYVIVAHMGAPLPCNRARVALAGIKAVLARLSSNVTRRIQG